MEHTNAEHIILDIITTAGPMPAADLLRAAQEVAARGVLEGGLELPVGEHSRLVFQGALGSLQRGGYVYRASGGRVAYDDWGASAGA